MDSTKQSANEINLAKRVRTNLLIFIDTELLNDKRKQIPILINSKTSEQLKSKYAINNFYQTIDTEIFYSNNNQRKNFYKVSISVSKANNYFNIVSRYMTEGGEIEESEENKIKKTGIFCLFDKINKKNKKNHNSIVNEILENETILDKKIKIGFRKINKPIQIDENSSISIKKKNNNNIDGNKITELKINEKMSKDNIYTDKIPLSDKNCSNYNLIKLENYCNGLIDIKKKEKKNNTIKRKQTKKCKKILKINVKKEEKELENSDYTKIKVNTTIYKSPTIGKSKFHCNKLTVENESPTKNTKKEKDLIKVQKKASCRIKKFYSINDSKILKFNFGKHDKEKVYLSPDIKVNKKIETESSNIMVLQRPKIIKFLSPVKDNERNKKRRNSNKQCPDNKQKNEIKRGSSKKSTVKLNFAKLNKNNNIDSPKNKKHKMIKENLELNLENMEDNDNENNIIKLHSTNDNENQESKRNNETENNNIRYSFKKKLANEINKINTNSPDIKKIQHNFNRSNTIKIAKSVKNKISEFKFNNLHENKSNKKIWGTKLKIQNKNKISDEK